MKLLWLDLETTGLDPQKDQILEVAACVADLERPFHAGPMFEAVIGMREDWRATAHPVVQEMHDKNGLWEAAAKSTTRLRDVELYLIEMTGRTLASDRENQTTLAGSCVSFDLAFIRQWMPGLASHLHYRVLDVSSVALFARALGMTRPPKIEAHRAAVDVRESIALGVRAALHCGRGWLDLPPEITRMATAVTPVLPGTSREGGT